MAKTAVSSCEFAPAPSFTSSLTLLPHLSYVDQQLRKSKRFDADGMERDNPELFRPLPRRYSRTSSSASLAGSGILDPPIKKMTALSSISDALKRSNSTTSEGGTRRTSEGHSEDGQLRYWTNEMCTKSPHLFDFVITVRLCSGRATAIRSADAPYASRSSVEMAPSSTRRGSSNTLFLPPSHSPSAPSASLPTLISRITPTRSTTPSTMASA